MHSDLNDISKFKKLDDLINSMEYRKDAVKIKPVAKFIFTCDPFLNILKPAIVKVREVEEMINSWLNTWDESIWEAFRCHGYSREWLTDLSNATRVTVDHFDLVGDVSVDVYSVDDVELFKVYISHVAEDSLLGHLYTTTRYVMHTK